MEKNISGKLNGLDHLRAFAIFSVFLYHYFILSGNQPAWLPGVAKFGWTGVDLFFVLSGFLISSQLFAQLKTKSPISFCDFFWKRFFRIIPAYLVTLALYFCLPFFRERTTLPPLWKFITFTQNFGLNLKEQGAFSHAWSLCVEEHFYLFLPLILMLLQKTHAIKKSFWLVIGLFALGMILRFYSFNHLFLRRPEPTGIDWYKYVYYPTYNRLDGLLTGVSIAALYHFLPSAWNRISKYGNLSILIGLIVLVAAYFLCEDQESFNASVFGFPTVAIGYGFLVLGAISPASFLYKWNSKLTTAIATLSYALYLTHKGVIHMTRQLVAGLEIEHNVLLLLCAAASIAFAYLMHIAVEKPFMKWRKKIVG